MNLAFRHLALGDFEIGLSKLNKGRKWRDDRLDLDGPFRLGFPQAPGWGEELLVASLLKRYAAASNSLIAAFGSWQVCSILKGDPVLQGEESGHNTQGRPPLAILRCALLGNLLENPFARLSSVCPLQLNRRRRVGIAWSSVEKNRPISYKSVPVERFLPILAAIKADFISLQRRRDVADPNCLLHEPDVRVLPDEVVTAATEGSLYKLVEEIRDLDCVVTVSTTTAHMAAAMGIRV